MSDKPERTLEQNAVANELIQPTPNIEVVTGAEIMLLRNLAKAADQEYMCPFCYCHTGENAAHNKTCPLGLYLAWREIQRQQNEGREDEDRRDEGRDIG